MHTPEHAFLSDIRATPDDDGIRLIYADWLEENGQPEQAELIRTQIELARLPEHDPKYETLAERQDELLGAHSEEWGKRFFESGGQRAEWRRGLIEQADLTKDDRVEEILRAAPIRKLRLRATSGGRLTTITRLPEFSQVRELTAQAGYPEHLNAVSLATSPGLGGLTSLSLNGLEQGREFAERLAASGSIQGLVRLAVTSSDLGDESVEALARSALLGRLTELDLTWNNLSRRGLQSLLSSSLAAQLTKLSLEGADFSEAGDVFPVTHLRRLEELYLYCANLGPGGLAALLAAPNLPSLRCLDLSENYLGDEGIRALCSTPHLRGLRELKLEVNYLSADGVAMLAQSTLWQGLRMVGLLDEFGDAGAAVLTDSPHLVDLGFWGCGLRPEGVEMVAGRAFPRLERLDLSGSREIGDEGIARLVARSRFPRLKALNISSTGLTHVGVRALGTSSLLKQLVNLDISQHELLGDAAAEILASSAGVTRLRELNLTSCRITDVGARAFASSRHFTRLQKLNLSNNYIQPDGAAATALRRRFGHRITL